MIQWKKKKEKIKKKPKKKKGNKIRNSKLFTMTNMGVNSTLKSDFCYFSTNSKIPIFYEVFGI